MLLTTFFDFHYLLRQQQPQTRQNKQPRTLSQTIQIKKIINIINHDFNWHIPMLVGIFVDTSSNLLHSRMVILLASTSLHNRFELHFFMHVLSSFKNSVHGSFASSSPKSLANVVNSLTVVSHADSSVAFLSLDDTRVVKQHRGSTKSFIFILDRCIALNRL